MARTKHPAGLAHAASAWEPRARLKDAVRALRGKRPKHSSVARQLAAERHAAKAAATEAVHGIRTADDLLRGVLTDDETALFDNLVASAREHGGPIVIFGALLGEAATSACLGKTPAQQVIVVDNCETNPWGYSLETFAPLVANALRYVVDAGLAVHAATDVRKFCRRYAGATPALVFVNYLQKDDDARHIIAWARKAGAQAIAGRGYNTATSDALRAVEDAGGPDRVEGDVWRLRQCPSTPSPTSTSDDSLTSIIVPAYNAREFIGEALADLDRQTYANWELIVVEDGSAQDVEAEIREFAAAHPDRRVVYRRKPANAGVSSARNDAMALCQGEFVAFLDADDRWLADHLQRKVRLLRGAQADLAYSRVETFDSETGRSLGPWGPTAAELASFPDSMFGRPYLQPSGVVVRRSLISDVGPFDAALAYAEDYDYWFRAIEAGKKFAFDEKITSRYRKNHASAATTDRLVLCFEGVAQISCRHLEQVDGDREARRGVVARHFVAAAAGHLGFVPTTRNRCRPDMAPALLQQARRLDSSHTKYRSYYWFARFALAARAPWLVRRYFHRKFWRLLALCMT